LSKYACAYSDFPQSEKVSDFPTAEEMRTYLESYCTKFDLKRYIQFNTEVLAVDRSKDGKWKVTTKNLTETFDFVCVSSGFFSTKSMPLFKNIDQFEGRIFHSSEYKDPSIFRGRRVAVIGGAFSGSEIAADLAKESSIETILLARRPMYYIPRTIEKRPVDLVFYSFENKKASSVEAKHRFLASLMKKSLCQGERKKPLRVPVGSADNPPYVAIAENFLQHIDRIEIHHDSISRFEKRGVVLNGEKKLQFDDVVFATGYRLSLSFLSKETLRILEFRELDTFKPLILHESVFHPNLPGLAFCGLYRGPYFAVMELQARWIMGVFSTRLNMPSEKIMLEGLNVERKIRDLKPRPQFPHSDYVAMAKRLAEFLLDVMPCPKKDQSGPLLPFHFRLCGFGSNERVARHAIEECQSRKW
jgi:dimethylaniline monooxygenase (N-oxide forming)